MLHIFEPRASETQTTDIPFAPSPNRRMNAGSVMVWITLLVGFASVLLFVVCVLDHQDAWPAALGSLALSAMGTSLGFFISRLR